VQDSPENSSQIASLEKRLQEQQVRLDQLRDSERWIRLFIENVRDYAFIMLDPQNRIVGWNAGAERMLGYREDEILGKAGAVIFLPEDVENGSVERELAAARSRGHAANERWHVRRDQSRFWGSGVVTPLYDEPGTFIGYCKIMRDLTDRKLAEDRLRQSEEHLRLLVENVTDCALFQVDIQGQITSWNPGAERTFGYDAEEILGRPFTCGFKRSFGGAG
jgi:PAS domain S-box-containing protein